MLNKRISKYPNKILQVKFCEYKSINDSIESEDILKKKQSNFQSQLKQYKNSSINTSNNKLKKNFVSLLIQTTSQVIKFVRRSGIRGANPRINPACSHSKRWLRQREDPLRARNSPEVRNKLRMAKVSPSFVGQTREID